MFFFSRENEKCPRRHFFAIFWGFVSVGIYFSRPLLHRFSRELGRFLGRKMIFFLGLKLGFLGHKSKNFLGFFAILGENLWFFSRPQVFFLGCKFAKFFTGTIFCSRAVSRFFLGHLQIFSGKLLKIFSGRTFFF